MTNNIDRAAEVLYNEHVGSRDTRYHLAESLDDAGLITPDAPKPNMTNGGFAMWNLAHIDISADSKRQTVYVDGNELTPEQARAEAAALLAAAAHATQEKE